MVEGEGSPCIGVYWKADGRTTFEGLTRQKYNRIAAAIRQGRFDLRGGPFTTLVIGGGRLGQSIIGTDVESHVEYEHVETGLQQHGFFEWDGFIEVGGGRR